MKSLAHGQQVKITGSFWCDEIIVSTLKGYCGEDKEAYKIAISRNEERAWTNKSPYCLTANYDGKENAILQKKDAFDKAVCLIDGEQVSIDGVVFLVKVNGLRYSDPISFIKVR